jgi:GT2 family glycosyltransferase
MLDFPLVYVIVLSWNGKKDTLECLASLQQLTYPNARIIVVDNSSSDGTGDAIRSAFPNIELIVNNSNLRFAGGNNVGIRQSLEGGAEYVLMLNNDTVVDPEFLGRLVEAAESGRKIGIVGPKIYYFDDPKRIWFAGGLIKWWRGRVTHIGIREVDNGEYDVTTEVDYITGCCMLIKREVIETIGMLDERYYIYGEDVDLCVRALRSGYKSVYVPSSRVWHKLSVSTKGHLSWFKNWNKLKSQLRLMARYARWYHWLTIPLAMPVDIMLSAAEVLFHQDTKAR